MRTYLFTFCFLLFSTVSIAQKTNDVIYLNNGSIYRGFIEEGEQDKIRLKTFSNNLIVFESSEIQKIESEPFVDERTIKSKGYLNFTSFGVLMGSTANEIIAPLSILMEHNYRYNTNFAFGIVTGLELLNEATVPLGFNAKGFIPLNGGSTFFIGASGGYSISVEDAKIDYYEVTDSYGGTMASAECGVMFPSYGHISMFIAAGYRYNELSYSRNDWQFSSVDRTIYYNRISLRVGINFY